MKPFRRPEHPHRQMILGVILLLTGIWLLFVGKANTAPTYEINAFDAIFVIPMLIKVFCYGILDMLAQLGIVGGLACGIGGIFSIVPVAMSEPEPTDYFSAGDVPNEAELRQMLESGEISREEYDEIRQYARQNGRK